MNLTKKILYRNCILSSISHAIMTNVYPELSYEQSWDGNNFSFQNGNGIRGTFSFYDHYCIGALRNDFYEIAYGETKIKKMMNNFPNDLIDIAFSETLQYLLVNFNKKAIPAVTSMFWCDDRQFSSTETKANSLQRDIENLPMFMDENKCFETCKLYYEMDSNSLELLNFLFKQKIKNYHKQIFLDSSKKKLFPGKSINFECLKSLEELGIYFR